MHNPSKTTTCLSVLLILLGSFSTSAQSWTSVGDDYLFEKVAWVNFEGFMGGCDSWETTGEVTIDGQTYLQMVGSFTYTQYDGETSTMARTPIYVRTEDASTYYLEDGVEYKSVDFDAEPGDSWMVSVYDAQRVEGYPLVQITVDSIGELTLGGELRQVMHYTASIDFSEVGCEDEPPYVSSNMAIEGLYHKDEIGQSFILPFIPDGGCISDIGEGTRFVHFEDDIGEEYNETSTYSGAPCGEQYTDLPQYRSESLEVYPTVFKDQLTLAVPTDLASSLVVQNVTGSIVDRIQIGTSQNADKQQIDLSGLEAGPYILSVVDARQSVRYSTKVVKMGSSSH